MVMKYVENALVVAALFVECMRVSCHLALKVFYPAFDNFSGNISLLTINAAARQFEVEVALFSVMMLLCVLGTYAIKHNFYDRRFFFCSNLCYFCCLLTFAVPAYVCGKWIMFKLALRNCDLGGLSDAIGLSSGWESVGVLWGIGGVSVWTGLHLMARRRFAMPWLSLAALFMTCLNFLILPKGEFLKTPLEMKMPYHLDDLLNASHSNEFAINWSVLSDTANSFILCSNPIGTVCLGKPPAIKRVVFKRSVGVVCEDIEQYFTCNATSESVIKERSYMCGSMPYLYYYIDLKGDKQNISFSEALKLVKKWGF